MDEQIVRVIIKNNVQHFNKLNKLRKPTNSINGTLPNNTLDEILQDRFKEYESVSDDKVNKMECVHFFPNLLIIIFFV